MKIKRSAQAIMWISQWCSNFPTEGGEHLFGVELFGIAEHCGHEQAKMGCTVRVSSEDV